MWPNSLLWQQYFEMKLFRIMNWPNAYSFKRHWIVLEIQLTFQLVNVLCQTTDLTNGLIHLSNELKYLKNKVRYGKIVEGIPPSF